MGNLIDRLYYRLGYFIVVKVMARRLGWFIAPRFPIPVDREKDYWVDDETGDHVYRHNAHSIMANHGMSECSTFNDEEIHPGTVFGCVACDVEGHVYRRLNLVQRIVLGTTQNRVYLDALSI